MGGDGIRKSHLCRFDPYLPFPARVSYMARSGDKQEGNCTVNYLNLPTDPTPQFLGVSRAYFREKD